MEQGETRCDKLHSTLMIFMSETAARCQKGTAIVLEDGDYIFEMTQV